MTLVLPVLASLGCLLLYLGLTDRARRSSRLGRRVRQIAVESGHPTWSPAGIAAVCLVVGAVAVVVAASVTGSMIVVVGAFLAAAWSPVAWLRGRARKRRAAHREQWPEAIALMISGIRAGLSLPEVVATLSDRGPEALRPHFHRFRVSYRSTTSFPIALDSLAIDLADPTADRVIAALKLAYDLGGTELVRVLRTLGDFVRDDLRVRKEVEARWSWTVSAARLAAASPWLVLLAMATRPEAAAAYDSPGGTLLVLGGAAATFVGYRLMLRAARLPEEERWIG